jgi:hypothetical protein
MAHLNKVLRSLNNADASRCVDIFRRPDGSLGFEEYRREIEDGRGWYAVGFHSSRRFDDEAGALEAAKQDVAWLKQVLA